MWRLCLLALAFSIVVVRCAPSPLWTELPSTYPVRAHQLRASSRSLDGASARFPKVPRISKAYRLSRTGMAQLLSSRSVSATLMEDDRPSCIAVVVPAPDGSEERICITPTQTMHPTMHRRYPGIQSFSITESYASDGGELKGTVTFNHGVFSAAIRSPKYHSHGGGYYIESVDPLVESDLHGDGEAAKHDMYWVFWRDNYAREDHRGGGGGGGSFRCLQGMEIHRGGDAGSSRVMDAHRGSPGVCDSVGPPNLPFDLASTQPIRTLRVAFACTSAYYEYFNSNVSQVNAEFSKVIARLNDLFESELQLTLQLIADNDVLIEQSESTDPYDPEDISQRLVAAHQVISTRVPCTNGGAARCFELGHLLHAGGGGGLASIGGVCSDAGYARGTTGLNNPVGDPFIVDYVMHEIGHQLGMTHTYDASNSGNVTCLDQRTSSSAYEVGSGSTIMGYAGLCDEEDIQGYTDPYYHWFSIQQAMSCIDQPACTWSPSPGAQSQNTSNSAPIITQVTQSATVPADTPFRLTADAFDPDGDSLTYTFEQEDLGDGTALGEQTVVGTMWRSFLGTSMAYRDFPLTPAYPRLGETLPLVDRTLRFIVSVRDGRGGVTMSDVIRVTVDSTIAPLVLDEPPSIPPNGTFSITWTVGGTASLSPSVAIILTDSQGQAYTMIPSTANNGSAVVPRPSSNLPGSYVKIRVQALTGIFFDEAFAPIQGFVPDDDQDRKVDATIQWDEDSDAEVPLDIRIDYKTLVAFQVTTGVHGLETTDSRYQYALSPEDDGYVKPAAPVTQGMRFIRRFTTPGRYYVRDPIAPDLLYGRILVQEEPIQCQFDDLDILSCPGSIPTPFWM